jgi:hypothetical protein
VIANIHAWAAQFIQAELVKHAKLVKQAGAVLEERSRRPVA